MAQTFHRRKRIEVFREITNQGALHAAWWHVNAQARYSKSSQIRREAAEFYDRYVSHLNRIQHRLTRGQFKFSAVRPVVIAGKRPVVIAQIGDRVVQRAILDGLMKVPAVQELVLTPTSFGGIPKKGVADAVAKALEIIASGCTHFIKTDIKSFFTKVPRREVVMRLATAIGSAAVVQLLEDASNAEVTSLAGLEDWKQEFDYDLFGVPQGCCLSPILANIALATFDSEMNRYEVRCLRYLDDILILAPSHSAAERGLNRARSLLKKDGLEIYEFKTDKFASGRVCDGFEYLGIDIADGLTRPNIKSRRRLLKKLDELSHQRLSIRESLDRIAHTWTSWQKQYRFTTDRSVAIQVQRDVLERTMRIIGKSCADFLRIREGGDLHELARLAGVPIDESLISGVPTPRGRLVA